MFIDWHTLIFGPVFIFDVPRNDLLILCSVGYLILRINIHSCVPRPKQLQRPEWVQHICRNPKIGRRWIHFGLVFGQLLLS
jgi:hypothetical protein